MGLGDGALVVDSDVCVVLGVVSFGAGGFSKSSVALKGDGSPVAVEDVGFIFFQE